jgi:two-component system, chemotaxis family, chemotaxis protein CheY
VGLSGAVPRLTLVPSGYVLVVEDDDEIRDFVALLLEGEGYAVRTARNGAEALDVVRDNAPRLILLDMRMPVMDGWGFARAYRTQPGPHAPILVMTAARDAAQRAHEIQADAYLAKPFDLDDLMSLVDRLTAPSGLRLVCAA